MCFSETQADSSLQATQLMLKRARLADSLNEKISQRPGPMELVEKNILPVESEAKDDDNGRIDLTATWSWNGDVTSEKTKKRGLGNACSRSCRNGRSESGWKGLCDWCEVSEP